MRDSNPRHPACKAGALPTELIAREDPMPDDIERRTSDQSVGDLIEEAQANRPDQTR